VTPVTTAPKKSAKKSPKAQGGRTDGRSVGRPFQRGGDPRSGRGPKKGAPNAGRPKDKIVELAAQGLEKALPLLIQTALGKATEIQKDEEGNETGYTVSASANERSKAVEVLGKVARKIGARIEVEQTGDKPFIVILRPE
jgi:hypothetical protein